jgi:MYXO-CTERM domain-containing protein
MVCTPPFGTLGGVAIDGTSSPQTPQSADGGGNAGTGNPGASGGMPALAPGGSSAGAPSSGCAIGGGASRSPLALSALALLGLLVVARRRR